MCVYQFKAFIHEMLQHALMHTLTRTRAHTNTDILHESGFKKPGMCLAQQFSCDLKYTQYTGIIIPNTGNVPDI